MELARLELADYNGDGFRTWRYLQADNPELYEDDYREMDEVLAQSLVAAAATALKANKSFSPCHAEHAAFWTDYLQNDSKEKWRRRNERPSGLPVLYFYLMHPHVEVIRYHPYMYGLTGDEAYQAEADAPCQAGPRAGQRGIYTRRSGKRLESAVFT